MSFVRRKRPVAVTLAMSSRARSVGLNPLKVKLRSWEEERVESSSRNEGIRSLENMARLLKLFLFLFWRSNLVLWLTPFKISLSHMLRVSVFPKWN